MTEFANVGRRIPKVDAREKVTGRASYINDLKLPGMLYGKILYSKYPHARIKHIDISKAESLPGVRAVLTGYNIPEIRVGFMKDNTPLKKGKVRNWKDEVAAVAAIDPDIAEAALDLIEVEYEELPGVFDPVEAMQDGAPLIHEFDPKGRPATSNILKLPWNLQCGDMETGKAAAAYTVSDQYRVTWVAHCCMGLSGCIAQFDLNNNLTMYSITQIPFLAQNDFNSALAAMGLKGKNTRIINTVIGGGFGSKLDTHIYEYIAILLSFKTRKPVKIMFTRAEEFQYQPPRQPAIIDVTQGCDKNGKLTFREVAMLLDNGAYTSWGATTPSVMMVPISSLYRVPNISYTAKSVYTNNIYSQAMRGYGNPQATFALECNLDQLAEQAGIDPLDFRMRNVNQPGEITPQNFKITTCGLKECLEKVADGLDWTHSQGRGQGRGVGIASLIHVGGGARVYKSDGHGMIMKLDDFGKISVITGAVEIGQGSETVLAQVTAEVLGLRTEDVNVIKGDTDICPWDVGTHASRQTFVSCNAAINTAAKIKQQILELASRHLGAAPNELDIKNRMIFVTSDPDNPERQMELDKLLRKVHYSRQGRMIMAEYFYDPPNEMLDREFKGNLSCCYAYGATGVEVEVDKETGQVKILQYYAAHDVGRALNPMLLEGQIYGAAVMGTGYALSEQLIVKNGRVMNDNFLDYKMLTAMDYIPVKPIIVEPVDSVGPFGAKGVGEPGCVPSAPAIANAIYDAVGVRIKDLPITNEKILTALKAKADKGEKSLSESG
ncbi:MAG: xanthine dehydrogenase family protein molybdopterin-binding subunit [Deltaproteobacteria bacterium]|nr:xanthine dehydrogenase family protein molybdopterin-binding subunit [Deltaproteobacteria bacterium]